jgi:hypothetical protein
MVAIARLRESVSKYYRKLQLWNTVIGSDIAELIKGAVDSIFSKVDGADREKMVNLKSFDELPEFINSEDEADLLRTIFLKGDKLASSEDVQSRIENIVKSFIKLDNERMNESGSIEYIINNIKTLAKTASADRDIKTKSSPTSFTSPLAGYKPHVDIAAKRKITKAFGDNNLKEVKAQLSAAGREDLAKLVGKKTEAEIMTAYNSGKPLTEGFVFNYDIIVGNLLNKFK